MLLPVGGRERSTHRRQVGPGRRCLRAQRITEIQPATDRLRLRAPARGLVACASASRKATWLPMSPERNGSSVSMAFPASHRRCRLSPEARGHRQRTGFPDGGRQSDPAAATHPAGDWPSPPPALRDTPHSPPAPTLARLPCGTRPRPQGSGGQHVGMPQRKVRSGSGLTWVRLRIRDHALIRRRAPRLYQLLRHRP